MAQLTECLVSVQEWMHSVKLKLNPDKTEFIIIGDKHTRELLKPKCLVKFLQSSITPTEELKNLEVTFDRHVSKVSLSLLLSPEGFATYL